MPLSSAYFVLAVRFAKRTYPFNPNSRIRNHNISPVRPSSTCHISHLTNAHRDGLIVGHRAPVHVPLVFWQALHLMLPRNGDGGSWRAELSLTAWGVR